MNRTLLALPLIALSLSACDLNPLMGKPSDAQLAHERRVSAGLGAAPNPWHTAEIVPVAVVACVDEFRAVRCVDGVATDYWTGAVL